MDNHEAHQAAMEQINNGASILPVDPLIVESFWDVLSSIPPERRGTAAVGLGAVAGGIGADDVNKLTTLAPEQHVALLTRVTLLNALSERGVLNEYLADGMLKQKLLTAIASIPFTKNDLAEALSHRILRDAPPEVAEKTRAEMIEAGLDPDFPNIAKRLISYVRDSE